MKRCILETPFAAPKELRDALDAANAALKVADNAVGGAHIERVRNYNAAYNARDKAQRAVSNAVAKHKRYLKACMRHLLFNGWAPFASHIIYPFCLDDNIPAERELGMNAGKPYWDVCEDVWFGIDLGWSPGMTWARGQHHEAGRNAHMLKLPPEWDKSSR